MPNKVYIGIDLGTTNTTCSILFINEKGNPLLFKLPIQQALFNNENDVTYFTKEGIIPSCVIVSETSNKIYCGEMNPDNNSLNYFPVRGAKSKLADDLWKVKVDNKFLNATDISAIILITVFESIKSFQKNPETAFNMNSVVSITITIPASFSAKMRRATIDAAIMAADASNMAGFKEEKIDLLDEPVAAIMSGYNINTHEFEKFIPDKKQMLVFDIGGGTVDVTVVQIDKADTSIEIKAISRYNELGGADIDLEIASLLLEKIKNDDLFKLMVDEIITDKARARAFANNLINEANSLKFEINEKINALDLPSQKMNDLMKRRDLPSFKIEIDNLISIDVSLSEIIEALKPYISIDSITNGRNIFKPLCQIEEKLGKLKYNFTVGGMSLFSLIALELGNQLNPLNNDLDATFSVSEGAVKFAFLKYEKNWKIVETTNEKVFLRRGGMPPLEVLPANLTIPSDEISPPEPLEGSYTIEWKAGTDQIQLEFFQGMSANDDIGLSFLNKVTIPLDEPILTTGILTMLKGQINSNKEFIFHIQISEQGEIICDEEIKFSKTLNSKRGNTHSSELNKFILNS